MRHNFPTHAIAPASSKFNLLDPDRLKDNSKGDVVPVRRDFPTNCGNFVSLSSRNVSPSNLGMIENRKQSKACFSLGEDDARRVASPLVIKKEVKDVVVKQRCEISYVLDDEALKMRENVINALNLFQDIQTEFLHEMIPKSKKQGQALCKVNYKVTNALHNIGKCVNVSKLLGLVPGVNVGDRFQCRAELKVIGLHHDFHFGIDYMEIDGKILATSIVDAHRYDNVLKSSRVLIYSGEGGNPSITGKPLKDQKFVKGNLALKNSMEARTPVRVILTSKISKKSNVVGTSGKEIERMMYIYDGLYIVGEYWKERGRFGNHVYKFKMVRIDEQPPFDMIKQAV
ncbi:YDG domain-containing protein At5g47150 [Ziziphus jujuba]|uniref:YDG domain-containing protein At5g47150 n=1 Tax=Ziziphus jujuba TaxID=326968 RepID=A0ABM3IE04_ZIZJJ|nr:YDG domain-containing protein At5g47150 [Ziziphus jujuba]